MIHSLVIKTLAKFKQQHNEQLYHDLITEEYKEFMEANTDEEKVAEAVDILWVVIGYLWSKLKTDTSIVRAYQTTYIANMSKVCRSEQEAIDTVKYYKTNKGYDCHYKQYTDSSGPYWIVYDENGKYKKSINFQKPDFSWLS